MRFYTASSLTNLTLVSRFNQSIRDLGHVVTYDWSTHGASQHAGELADDIRVRLSNTAMQERDGVVTADIVVVILPGGRGTHVELGMAIASGATILMVVRPEDKLENPCCCFHYAEGVHHLVVHGDIPEVQFDAAVIGHALALSRGETHALTAHLSISHE